MVRKGIQSFTKFISKQVIYLKEKIRVKLVWNFLNKKKVNPPLATRRPVSYTKNFALL